MKHTTHNRGFSLIELMVALSIFAIVMTVSVGSLLVLIDANSKAQALTSAMTNLSFALDSITRNLRTGRDFYCTNASSLSSTGGQDRLVVYPNNGTNDCLEGASQNDAVVFTPGFSTNTRMAYRLHNGAIEQWIDRGGVNDGWVPITSNQPPTAITITDFEILLRGSESAETGDDEQPQISILVGGTVQNGLESLTDFEIQSTVTQRVLNY